jgi:hypothetical protein
MRLLSVLFLILSAAVASAVAPNRATGLTATPIANKSIRLTWLAPTLDGAPAADGYKVYRATAAVPTPVELTPTKITQLTYTDSSPELVVGTSYIYTVVAMNGTDSASPSDPATASPLDLPGAPGNLRTTNITSTTISLAWNSVSGSGVTYTVYRDDDPVGEDLTGTTFTDTGLELSTTYSYVVTATTTAGESGDSNVVTVTTFGDGTGKAAVWAKRFRQIDVDANGLLTLDEYIAGHGARLAWVVVVHRFEYSDSDASGDLNLAEYAKAFGGRKFMSPSKPRQFYLADLDQDGLLDSDEYALTRGARTKQTLLDKSFEKLDKDPLDGFLSPLEMKIRNYAPPT